jgi:hypothetical protein
VNRQGIVAFHQQMASPVADTNDEKLDLEIGWGFPVTKYFKNSLLGILVLHRRTLRTFEPADHGFHVNSFLYWSTVYSRLDLFHPSSRAIGII